MQKIPDWWDKERVPIKWYEWIYDINENWQVRTYWKIGNCKNKVNESPLRYIRPWEKYAKWTSINARPSAMVTLYDEKKWKRTFYLSRLVAVHFNLMTEEQFNDKNIQVIHKDSNMMNAKKDNLYIWTASERHINYLSNK